VITFGARYISPVQIQKTINKKEIVPYRTALVELLPNSQKDFLSLGVASTFLIRKSQLVGYIHDDFALASIGDIATHEWRRFLAITEEQENYNFIKPRNILGLIEFSAFHTDSDYIYVDYIQTMKKILFDKFSHVGTSMLDCIKKLYPQKDIELDAFPKTVKFYEKNGFEVITHNTGKDDLIGMKYYCQHK